MHFGNEKSLSIYEKKIIIYQKKNWFSQVKSSSDFSLYKGDSIPISISGNPQFLWVITYISELYESVAQYGIENLPSDLIDEVIHFEREGKLCVYLSILTYTLLMYHGIANEREMKYVQGYYQHKTEATNWIARSLGDEHAGSHAWITIGKAVIDISIKQEEMFFRFDGYPVILGQVPPGLILKGFSEPKKTANKFIEQIVKRRKLSFEEWVNEHNEQLENISKKQTL
jgi:hypothetical protein